MSEFEKNVVVEKANDISRFFEVRFVIQIFGHVIVDYTWPPKKS